MGSLGYQLLPLSEYRFVLRYNLRRHLVFDLRRTEVLICWVGWSTTPRRYTSGGFGCLRNVKLTNAGKVIIKEKFIETGV